MYIRQRTRYEYVSLNSFDFPISDTDIKVTELLQPIVSIVTHSVFRRYRLQPESTDVTCDRLAQKVRNQNDNDFTRMYLASHYIALLMLNACLI